MMLRMNVKGTENGSNFFISWERDVVRALALGR